MHGWGTRMRLKHYLDQGVSKAELSRRFGISERTIHYWVVKGQLERDLAVGGAIPFVLDPDTSEPLPRLGRQTGRAAFFDVGCETRWGGFITGDEITVNWSDYCPCGRQSHYIEGEIQRYSEKRGGDDKITCAATESAHQEAMDYLTSIESDA